MSRRTRSEARVGVELDSDQFVGPGVDYMLLACDSVQATAFILVFLIFLPIVSGLGSCFFLSGVGSSYPHTQ